MSSSEDLNQLDDHKKVRWAFNLEEIVYFTPCIFEYEDTERRKASKSILKKFKKKARALRIRNLDICDDLLQKMQDIFERIAEKVSGHSGEIHIEDLNRQWDELFELYGECKPELTCYH